MEYCDCGAPLAFSPDGMHCLGCYEAIANWPVDEHGELLPNPTGEWWWCYECDTWHRGQFCPKEMDKPDLSGWC
jgi:hypothetical protein